VGRIFPPRPLVAINYTYYYFATAKLKIRFVIAPLQSPLDFEILSNFGADERTPFTSLPPGELVQGKLLASHFDPPRQT